LPPARALAPRRRQALAGIQTAVARDTFAIRVGRARIRASQQWPRKSDRALDRAQDLIRDSFDARTQSTGTASTRAQNSTRAG